VLLAASGGGHLHELAMLSRRVTPSGWRCAWLVPPGPQSADVVGADDCYRLRDTDPRDFVSVLANVPRVGRVLRQVRPAAVVSTGAAAAISALGVPALLGVESHYVESAARTEGPSLTGRLVSAIGGVECYAQWPTWRQGSWPVPGNVFDGFTAHSEARPGSVSRVVVMLGTQAGYGFSRAVARLREILPADVDVVWQVGSTDPGWRPPAGGRILPPAELRRAVARADVVVAHAGVGSALTALSAGRCPVLLPREQVHGEHVDDHQVQIATTIDSLGLAVGRRVEELTFADLRRAASVTITYRSPGALRLGGRLGRALAAGR